MVGASSKFTKIEAVPTGQLPLTSSVVAVIVIVEPIFAKSLGPGV